MSQGIQSLEQAYDILKVVADSHQPISITELSSVCGMSKSKVHKYLVSLTRIGFLSKGRDLKYALGTELLLLGLRASQQIDIRSRAQPYVSELNEQLNETAALAIWGASGPFFVLWQQSNRTVNIGIQAGTRVSLSHSATGLVFAAFMPSEQTRLLLQQDIEAGDIDAPQVYARIARVRNQGYATVEGDLIPGIAAIAAPVFNQIHEVIGCLTVVGVLGAMRIDRDATPIQVVRDSARRLSAEFGYLQ